MYNLYRAVLYRVERLRFLREFLPCRLRLVHELVQHMLGGEVHFVSRHQLLQLVFRRQIFKLGLEFLHLLSLRKIPAIYRHELLLRMLCAVLSAKYR